MSREDFQHGFLGMGKGGFPAWVSGNGKGD